MFRRHGFNAVVGDERAGLHILNQEPDLDGVELAEFTSRAARAIGPVDAEDPAQRDGHLGMRTWRIPVMLRQPGAVARPAARVIRVRTPRSCERLSTR
ncbi:hypothetical protein O7622_15590 [Micromonospora sp. WMMD1076]|uniref:hypothetical protein n=1 Tax=Micromonospora sp. WMMD1076 TaxID=3016103 RepID=UPI00249BE89C|nr:hypothetical protein [Micromonospora sp. WMMD1076]WFF04510.1 hypothetical protein O7622_15590 [Micromonospora sp. WMMD1076]